MKQVYLLTYMEFKKEEQNVITNIFAFSNESEAITFKKSLEDIQCGTIILLDVFETAEQAITYNMETKK